MFKRNYTGTTTNGQSGSFGVAYVGNITPVVGFDATLLAPVPDAVVRTPRPVTLTNPVSGTMEIVAEVMVGATSLALGVDNGVIIAIPPLEVPEAFSNGIAGTVRGYTVGNMEVKGDTPLYIDYSGAVDMIDVTPLSPTPNDPADIDPNTITVGEFVNAPDNLRYQVRSRTSTNSRKLYFIRVPTVGGFNVYGAGFYFTSPTSGSYKGSGLQAGIQEILIPVVL